MVAKNPGEQFYMFSSIAAWLICKSGRQFEKPQEFDDPNATISRILEVVRENVIGNLQSYFILITIVVLSGHCDRFCSK